MGWIQLNRYKIKVYGEKGSIKNIPSDEVAFLHNLLTNDIKNLKAGQFNYNLRLTGTGEPVADFFVYREKDFFILDTNINPEILIQELNRLKLSLKVFFEELDYKHIFVFGETIKKLVEEIPEKFHFTKQNNLYFGRNPVRYGLDGIDIFGNLSQLKSSLLEEDRLTEEQAEKLRITNCIPKIGKELRKGFHPLETNILYAFSFNKGCYVGQEAIARVYFRGRTPRTLALFETEGKVKEGEKILKNNKPVGTVTSVSPDGKLCLGYILRSLFKEKEKFSTETGYVKIIRQCEHQF